MYGDGGVSPRSTRSHASSGPSCEPHFGLPAGHESPPTVERICGDEDHKHVKTWRLDLFLFRALMTMWTPRAFAQLYRHVLLFQYTVVYKIAQCPLSLKVSMSGYCNREVLPSPNASRGRQSRSISLRIRRDLHSPR